MTGKPSSDELDKYLIGGHRSDEEPTPRTMRLAIRKLIIDRYGAGGLIPFEKITLPEGLVLQIHPSVYNRILTDPGAFPYLRPPDLTAYFEVPATVEPRLPEGTWMLAIVKTEVLLGGTL